MPVASSRNRGGSRLTESRKLQNIGVTVALFASLWITLSLLWFLLARQSTNALWATGAFAAVLTAAVYFRCSDYPVRAMKARPVMECEEPVLYQLVRELATAARMPMPRLYISPAPAPNAFATGRSPRAAIVCCTQGLLDALSERELRAVLAHEMMHVKHRETLACSIVGTFSGLLAGLSGFLVQNMARRRSFDRILTGCVVLLAPLLAIFVQVAVSRARELRADKDAAELTGDPLGLALALGKLGRGADGSPLPATSQYKAVAYLMTAKPFRTGPARLFDTHPPLTLRIARLERAAFDRFTGS